MPHRLANILLGREVRAGRRLALAAVALAVATGLWLGGGLRWAFTPPLAHYFVAGDGAPAPGARALARRQLDAWQNGGTVPADRARMRRTNAEWDFMGRTFLVLALANLSLREPARQAEYLAVMDRILADTVAREARHGMTYFLMDYVRPAEFVNRPARSLFVDGEIALMYGARRLVADREDYREPHRQRLALIVEYLSRPASQVGCAESYQDECWLFCNSLAIAALKAGDAVDNTDHGAFCAQWLRRVRTKLIHEPTGLLCSSFTLAGDVRDGPEGSTLWTVCHWLQLVDESFARDQYLRARRELRGSLCGFGYAREWPDGWAGGAEDVDSGPIVPGLRASAGSSGQALLGATAFGDAAFARELLAALHLAGFPVARHGRLAFAASNQVGDAVLLYAMVQGPLWRRIQAATAAARPEGAR